MSERSLKSASRGQRPESSVQRPESSVHRPQSIVQCPESIVQSPESSVQRPASRVQRPESVIQSPASRVQRPEPSVQSPVSRVQRRESSVQLLRPESRNSGMSFLSCFKKSEAAVSTCSSKEVFLKISQYSGENICIGDSFYQSCRPATLLQTLKNFQEELFS